MQVGENRGPGIDAADHAQSELAGKADDGLLLLVVLGVADYDGARVPGVSLPPIVVGDELAKVSSSSKSL